MREEVTFTLERTPLRRPRPAFRVESASLGQIMLLGVAFAATAGVFLTHAMDEALGAGPAARAAAAIVAALLVVLPLVALHRESRLLRTLGRLLAASPARVGHGPVGAGADSLDVLEAVSQAYADELVDLRRRLRGLEDEEQKTRRVLQQMAPPSFRQHLRGLDVAGWSRACGRAGGDWYVVRELDEGHVLVALGDVAGHDAASAYAAAALAGALRAMCRSRIARSLGAVLLQLEALLDDMSGGRLTTSCVLLLLDPASGRVRYVNAGHPAPWVLREGTVVKSFSASGGPLGLRREQAHRVRRFDLEAGDRLLFFSDGLLEQADAAGRLFGTRRVLESARATLHRGLPTTSQQLLEDLLQAFRQFSADVSAIDDVSMVVCQFQGAARTAAGVVAGEVDARPS